MTEAVAWTWDVLVQWRRWIGAHLGMTILLSILAFIFGWAWNTYVMAVNLDGSVPEAGTRTIATAEGLPFNALFWMLFFALLSGLVTYAWTRGWSNLWSDLAVLPRRLRQTLRQNRAAAIALLLWGMSISLVISTLISSAVSLALGLVLLTLAATPIGTILNFALIRLWKGLCGIATPSAGLGAVLIAGPFLVMLGEAFGLLLDWVFASWLIGLILGIAAAVTSLLLARGAARVVTPVLFGLWFWAQERRALADDGGWNECITESGERCADLGLGGVIAWFGSEGAGTVLAHGAVGGVFAGLGTAIGAGMGSVAASLAVAGAQAAGTRPMPPASSSTPASPTLADSAHGDPTPGDPTPGDPAPGDPTASYPTPADPTASYPTPADPTADGGAADSAAGNERVQWQTVANEQPIVPQQPDPPEIEDFLPDAPERKRKDQDNP